MSTPWAWAARGRVYIVLLQRHVYTLGLSCSWTCLHCLTTETCLHTGPELHMDMSTLSYYRDMSTHWAWAARGHVYTVLLQRHVYTLGLSCTWTCLHCLTTEACAYKGLNCTWMCQDNRSLCCFWTYLHYRGRSSTWMYLDNRSLWCFWTFLHSRDLHRTWMCLHYSSQYFTWMCLWSIGALAAHRLVSTTEVFGASGRVYLLIALPTSPTIF